MGRAHTSSGNTRRALGGGGGDGARTPQAHVLALLVAHAVERADQLVAQAVLLRLHEQPAGVGRVWPRLPVGVGRALPRAHCLHRAGPAVSAPAPPVVRRVLLAIGLGARVDHERVVVDLHLHIRVALAKGRQRLVQADLGEVAPGSRDVGVDVEIDGRDHDEGTSWGRCSLTPPQHANTAEPLPLGVFSVELTLY